MSFLSCVLVYSSGRVGVGTCIASVIGAEVALVIGSVVMLAVEVDGESVLGG
jgi:hypothetical protein